MEDPALFIPAPKFHAGTTIMTQSYTRILVTTVEFAYWDTTGTQWVYKLKGSHKQMFPEDELRRYKTWMSPTSIDALRGYNPDNNEDNKIRLSDLNPLI